MSDTLPIVFSLLLGCIGIIFHIQRRQRKVVNDRPKYKGYYPYTKSFQLKNGMNSEQEVIIVGKNNFSLMYDMNRKLICARGTIDDNSKLILNIHSNKTMKDVTIDTSANILTKKSPSNNSRALKHDPNDDENDDQEQDHHSAQPDVEVDVSLDIDNYACEDLKDADVSSVVITVNVDEYRYQDSHKETPINTGTTKEKFTKNTIRKVRNDSAVKNLHDIISTGTVDTHEKNESESDEKKTKDNEDMDVDTGIDQIVYDCNSTLSNDVIVSIVTEAPNTSNTSNTSNTAKTTTTHEKTNRIRPADDADDKNDRSNNGKQNNNYSHLRMASFGATWNKKAVCTLNVKVKRNNSGSIADDSKQEEDLVDTYIGLNNITNKGHQFIDLENRLWFIEENARNNNSDNNDTNIKTYCKHIGSCCNRNDINNSNSIDDDDNDYCNKNTFKIGVILNNTKMYLHSSHDGEVRLVNLNPVTDNNDIPLTKTLHLADTYCQHELKMDVSGTDCMCNECLKKISGSKSIVCCNKCNKIFCVYCVRIFCPGKHNSVKYNGIRLNEGSFYCTVCNKTYDNYYPVYGCQLCYFDVCYNCVQLYKQQSISEQLTFGFSDTKTYSKRLHHYIVNNEKEGFDFHIFEEKDTKVKKSDDDGWCNCCKNKKISCEDPCGVYCCCPLFYVRMVNTFKFVGSLTPIFDIATDLWALMIYISEGDKYKPYAITSIIILYFSNRLYFCCWFAVELLGVKLNLQDNITIYDIVSASLLPIIGYVKWFNVNLTLIFDPNAKSQSKKEKKFKRKEFKQWVAHHIFVAETGRQPIDRIQFTRFTFLDRRNENKNKGFAYEYKLEKKIRDEIKKLHKCMWDIDQEKKQKSITTLLNYLSDLQVQERNEYKQMADRERCRTGNIWIILCDVLLSLLFIAFIIYCVVMIILLVIIFVKTGKLTRVFNIENFTAVYVVFAITFYARLKRFKNLWNNRANRFSIIIDLIYAPCIYTFYLIVEHSLLQCKLTFKQLKCAWNWKNNSKNKIDNLATIGDYIKAVKNESLNSEESRNMIVFKLLRSFASIFETFPQLLLQCYVYYCVRLQHEENNNNNNDNSNVAFIITLQFYLSTLLSLFSTCRSLYRLLASNLFTRGLKYTFDFVAVFSVLGLSYISKQFGGAEKILDFNLGFNFDFNFPDLNFDFDFNFPDFNVELPNISNDTFGGMEMNIELNAACGCGECTFYSIDGCGPSCCDVGCCPCADCDTSCCDVGCFCSTESCPSFCDLLGMLCDFFGDLLGMLCKFFGDFLCMLCECPCRILMGCCELLGECAVSGGFACELCCAGFCCC